MKSTFGHSRSSEGGGYKLLCETVCRNGIKIEFAQNSKQGTAVTYIYIYTHTQACFLFREPTALTCVSVYLVYHNLIKNNFIVEYMHHVSRNHSNGQADVIYSTRYQ